MDILVNNIIYRLTAQDFLDGGQGGQGKVYVQGNLAYKIYTERKHVHQLSKIKELSVLSKANICKPLDIIKDTNHRAIGFTMNYVTNGIPLCKFFTSAYWHKHNISVDEIIKIIDQLQEGIKYIHSKNILLVDINEFNFLVLNRIYPYFIDVDSYQTQTYKATAIMPHIRDYHRNNIDILTDWFSFAIIACQLLVGIHPFKGTHPDYSKKELIKRMKDNISIFNPKVKLPVATRDFSHIPQQYKNWFIALFEEGKRFIDPPSIKDTQIVITKAKTTEIKGDFEVKFISDLVKKEEIFFMGEKICNLNGIDFVYMGDYLIELFIDKTSFAKEIIAPRQSWRVLPHATQIMDGVIIQNMLGKKHLSFFYKNGKGKTCYSILHIPEMDGCKIVEAKQEKGVYIIIGYQKGQYDEFILKFNSDYTKYSIQKMEDIDYVGINFTVLDNGITVTFEDGYARIFSNSVDSDKIRKIINPSINPKMRICSDGNQVRYVEDDKLYSIRVI
jgi:serine/threonine protein kinase